MKHIDIYGSTRRVWTKEKEEEKTEQIETKMDKEPEQKDSLESRLMSIAES